MANMCSNIVQFEFFDEKLKEEFLQWIKAVRDERVKGFPGDEFPPKLIGNLEEWDRGFGYGWLDDETFSYETKWAPNTFTLIKAAKAYKFSFTADYEEGGDLFYGQGQFDLKENSYSSRRVPEEKYLAEEDNEDNDSLYDALDEALEEEEWVIGKT